MYVPFILLLLGVAGILRNGWPESSGICIKMYNAWVTGWQKCDSVFASQD
jgi:hypothetical protein